MPEEPLTNKPHDEPAPHVQTKLRDPLIMLGLVLVGLVLLTWIILLVLGASRSSEITTADASITEQDKALQGLSTTFNQYSALEQVKVQTKVLRNKRYLFLDSWKKIKENAPKDVQFVSVSVGSQGLFRISGVTKSVTSVANFTKALSQQENITQVAPLSVDKQNNGSLFNFTISFKAAEGQQAKGTQ